MLTGQPKHSTETLSPGIDISERTIEAAGRVLDGDVSQELGQFSETYSELSTLFGKDSVVGREFIKQAGRELDELSDVEYMSAHDYQSLRGEIDDRLSKREITPQEYDRELEELSHRWEQNCILEARKLIVENYESESTFEVLSESVNIAKLEAILKRASSMHPEIVQTPPMQDIEGNTTTTWKHVPDAEIRDFLSQHTFADRDTMHRVDQDRASSTLIRASGVGISIPIKLIVHATGFDSWHGRRNPDGEEGGGNKYLASPSYPGVHTTSINVIKGYAAEQGVLPAVDVIDVYVEPDGTIFADNEGDSHRIAAAILRGEENIIAANVRIVFLKSNHLV